MANWSGCASAHEFRDLARRSLPHFLFEYYDGAAFEARTANANIADLGRVELRQRVLRDVSAIDTATQVLGASLSMPVALSPVGLAGMAARRGEAQAARAAATQGIPFALSTTSLCELGEIAAVAPPWFQLYMIRDRGFVSELLQHALGLGCTTLLLTVDLPILGIRWRDGSSGLNQRGPAGEARRLFQAMRRPGWAWDVGLRGRPHNLGNFARAIGRNASMADCMAFSNANLDAALDARAIRWVREQWPGRLVVKGVLEPEDARMALDLGADALVVSNHGGRQLDGVTSTAKALVRIADALGGTMPLLVDGGVRTGLDVLRMLALGADCVMLGRPWVYALAAGGEPAVSRLLQLLELELRIAMALTGCTTISAINRSVVRLAQAAER